VGRVLTLRGRDIAYRAMAQVLVGEGKKKLLPYKISS